MNTMPATSPSRHVTEVRQPALTAALRCQCYAAWSELIASPHDVQVRPALTDRLSAAGQLPWAAALPELIVAYLAADPVQLKAEYSGLFEVGSDGPPVPIREDLQTGQKGGTREDIVRFYDYFGYRLGDRFAWAPDHLSVELEFMHYLCYHETLEDSDRLSFQLAQFDFAERHLQKWLPRLAAAAQAAAPDGYYSSVLVAVRDFVAADVGWQASTITSTA